MASTWLAYKQSNNTERFKTWLGWANLSQRDYQVKANAWCERRDWLINIVVESWLMRWVLEKLLLCWDESLPIRSNGH